MVSFNCSTFCPETEAKYHCEITSQASEWTVSGSVSGSTTYRSIDAIGLLKPIGSSFTANKTSSISISLKFTANVEFNNNVNVTCLDQNDADPNTSSRQCTIKIESKDVLNIIF